MKLKKGVNIQSLNIKTRPALIAAEQIWNKYKQELVVTCGLDSEHSAGSFHYYGLALDFRTNYFQALERTKAFERLGRLLGNSFNVILHSTHIHVEYDP